MAGKLRSDTLIKSLKPLLHEGVYVFCTLKDLVSVDLDKIICFFKENEGVTIILKKENADKARYLYSYQAAWITLTVHTSLNSIGLSAAVSQALSEKKISCNIVAGFYHDHLFVPKDRAQDAMKILMRLSGGL